MTLFQGASGERKNISDLLFLRCAVPNSRPAAAPKSPAVGGGDADVHFLVPHDVGQASSLTVPRGIPVPCSGFGFRAGPNMLYPSGQSYTKLGTISAPLFCAFALRFPLFARVSVKNCTIDRSKQFKAIQRNSKQTETGTTEYPTYSNFNPTRIQVQSRFNPT